MANKTTGISGNKYDPADFIIPANDHQGHSERVWCRVQPAHDRQIDVVLRSKNFPFRTKGDVVRWALVRGLKLLLDLEPTTKGFLQQAEVIQGILRDEIYMQEFSSMFSTLERVVGAHISMGAKSEATKLINKTRAELNLMNSEPHWKQKCVEELDKRFGHLISGKTQPIGLHRVEMEVLPPDTPIPIPQFAQVDNEGGDAE